MVPLRADAARAAVADVLATHQSVSAVSADIEDGAPVVTVTVTDAKAAHSIEQILGRLPLSHRVTAADS